MNIFYVLISIIILWSAWGYFSSRVEKTQYTVLDSKNNYEIRLYPEHIVAQTVIKGSYTEALNQGFRIIAGYIFGGNTKKESIVMTSPVVEKSSKSESIAMTSPVTATVEGETHTITFAMPRSYTLKTLPTPNDDRIQIVTIPEKKMAAIRFSWIRTDARVQAKKQELIDLLKKDNITIMGEVQYAGYSAPWTPPWMTRNEVLVDIIYNE
jgi:effector-binding domain-containing protein